MLLPMNCPWKSCRRLVSDGYRTTTAFINVLFRFTSLAGTRRGSSLRYVASVAVEECPEADQQQACLPGVSKFTTTLNRVRSASERIAPLRYPCRSRHDE